MEICYGSIVCNKLLLFRFNVNNNNLLQLLPFYCLRSLANCMLHTYGMKSNAYILVQLHEVWKGDHIIEVEIRSSDFVTFLQTAFTKSGICKALLFFCCGFGCCTVSQFHGSPLPPRGSNVAKWKCWEENEFHKTLSWDLDLDICLIFPSFPFKYHIWTWFLCRYKRTSKQFLSVFGEHLISMNIPTSNEVGWYTSLKWPATDYVQTQLCNYVRKIICITKSMLYA
jgi:hypothetical protein